MAAAQKAQEQAAYAAAARERQAARAEMRQVKLAERAQKQEIKAQKAAMKEAKKQDAIEKAKITSDESLEKTAKLCLVGGYIGVHDFALGKILPGVIKVIIAFYAIFGAIGNRRPELVFLLAVNIIWWWVDYIRIKSGKFTDKLGHSIRE